METVIATTGFVGFLTEMLAPLLLCSSIPLGSPPVQDPALTRVRRSSASCTSVGPASVLPIPTARTAPSNFWPIPKSAACEPKPRGDFRCC